MHIQYREMTIDDYEPVINLWKNSENIGMSNADSLKNLTFYLERNPGMSFIALDGEQLVGAALCGHDGRRGAIYHLAVLPAARQQGIGRQLVQHCLIGLQRAGIERCHIHVYSANAAGLQFWQNNGWFLRPELELLSIDLV